jgi:DNA-binding IclR family transcriptional regulator
MPEDASELEERTKGLPKTSSRQVSRRLVRVLSMLRLIEHEPREWTRARLAEHFGVTERMADNDLALLRQAGYDVRRHPGGYALGDATSDAARKQEQARAELRRAGKRERARALRERRKAAGLCITCGMPAERPHTRCAECLAKMRQGR